MRYAWAKAQVDQGDSTPALVKYLADSFSELGALKTADLLEIKERPHGKPKCKLHQSGAKTELFRAGIPYCVECMNRVEPKEIRPLEIVTKSNSE